MFLAIFLSSIFQNKCISRLFPTGLLFLMLLWIERGSSWTGSELVFAYLAFSFLCESNLECRWLRGAWQSSINSGRAQADGIWGVPMPRSLGKDSIGSILSNSLLAGFKYWKLWLSWDQSFVHEHISPVIVIVNQQFINSPTLLLRSSNLPHAENRSQASLVTLGIEKRIRRYNMEALFIIIVIFRLSLGSRENKHTLSLFASPGDEKWNFAQILPCLEYFPSLCWKANFLC